MSYLTLSKKFQLLENDSDCENNHIEEIQVSDFYTLETILTDYNHDMIPNHILIDIRVSNGLTEEALATPDELILTVDSTKLDYDKTIFLVKWFCNKKAVIKDLDEGCYCSECFEKRCPEYNLTNVLEILESEDQTRGLSTAKKIQYILIKNRGQKLSSRQIFEEGKPWEAQGQTPWNTIYSRCSTLFEQGIIKRKVKKYYVD